MAYAITQKQNWRIGRAMKVEVGAEVIVNGLQKAAQYNGKRGVVICWFQELGASPVWDSLGMGGSRHSAEVMISCCPQVDSEFG